MAESGITFVIYASPEHFKKHDPNGYYRSLSDEQREKELKEALEKEDYETASMIRDCKGLFIAWKNPDDKCQQ